MPNLLILTEFFSIEKVLLIKGETISSQKYELPENMTTLVQNGIRNHYAAPEIKG